MEDLKRDLEDDYKHGWNPWKKETPETLRTPLTLGDAIDETLASMRPNIKPSTFKNRVQMFDTLSKEFGINILFENLPVRELEDWINEAKAFSYRERRKGILSMMFDYLKEEYGITKPEFKVNATREEKKRYYNKDFKTFLLKEQVEYVIQYMINHAPKSHWAYDRNLIGDFLRLSFLTGRRMNEIASIRGEWIKTTQPMLELFDEDYSTKGGEYEYILLNNEAWVILKRLKKPGNIFSPITGEFVSGVFRETVRACLPANLARKVSLHKLRDSAIMHKLYIEKMDLVSVMDAVGHDAFSSTQKYRHKNGLMIIQSKQQEWKEWLMAKNIEENGVRMGYNPKLTLVKKAN